MKVSLGLGGIFERQSFPIQALLLVSAMLFFWAWGTKDWRFLAAAVVAILAALLLDLCNRPSVDYTE